MRYQSLSHTWKCVLEMDILLFVKCISTKCITSKKKLKGPAPPPTVREIEFQIGHSSAQLQKITIRKCNGTLGVI